VEGLGDFLELEVVLRPEQSEIEGKDIATKLLADFSIDRSKFISEAYVDILTRQAITSPNSVVALL
jgi:adenylate cyclase class IV